MRIPASRLASGTMVRCAFFFGLVAWALAVGKEVSWDLLNHQFYLPFSWLGGRFRTDLFAASLQSFQNPLGYFPMYALIRADLPAWVVGVVLAASHALVVWPLDRIARLFWPGEGEEDFWFRLLALAFCCTTPILLFIDGTTSSDPISNLLVVWAVAFTLEAGVADASGPGKERRAAIAGALLGVASAIKFSNAVLAVVLCGLWVVKWSLGQVRFRRIAAFGGGLAIAFIAAAGWWMAWLWRDFGDPLFPFYNTVFHSPYLPSQPLISERFVTKDPWAMVQRLWEMTSADAYVVFEDFVPDARPLLAAISALVAAVVIAARGRWRLLSTRAAWVTPGAQLAIFLVLGYILWMRSSGNARYALPLLVLVGIVLVRAATRALPFSAAKIFLLTALLLQTGNYLLYGDHRFVTAAWNNDPYFQVRVSERLRTQPFLHLSVGTQTYSAVAPFLAQDGAMSNPFGLFELPADGALGERLQALMNRWHGRTRVLLSVQDEAGSSASPSARAEAASKMHANLSVLLYRLGVDVNWDDCEHVDVAESTAALASHAGSHAGAVYRLLSCAVVYRADKNPALDAQRVIADKVFAILEAACPRAFSPVPFASEQGRGVEQRHYVNNELVMTVSIHDGVSATQFRTLQPFNFGSIDDVLNHRKPIQCPEINNRTPH